MDIAGQCSRHRWLPPLPCAPPVLTNPFSRPQVAPSFPALLLVILSKKSIKKIAGQDFALKTESQISPLFYYLMIWFQRDRAFLSFLSSNQKAPYSNYILLGVNQHFENNSLQISICKVNKDIYGSHQPVPNQNVNYSQVLQDGEFCFGFVGGTAPFEPRATQLCRLCVSLFSLLMSKLLGKVVGRKPSIYP